MGFDKKNFFAKEGLAPLFVIIGASLWGVDGIVLRPALFRSSCSIGSLC